MSSVIGVGGGTVVTVDELGGVEELRDEFHIAIAAIASASTAIAGSKYERTPEGAGAFDAGGPDTGVGEPVTGSGVATGGSGIGGVT